MICTPRPFHYQIYGDNSVRVNKLAVIEPLGAPKGVAKFVARTALPNGLCVCGMTGVISGIPTLPKKRSEYTIAAVARGGKEIGKATAIFDVILGNQGRGSFRSGTNETGRNPMYQFRPVQRSGTNETGGNPMDSVAQIALFLKTIGSEIEASESESELSGSERAAPTLTKPSRSTEADAKVHGLVSQSIPCRKPAQTGEMESSKAQRQIDNTSIFRNAGSTIQKPISEKPKRVFKVYEVPKPIQLDPPNAGICRQVRRSKKDRLVVSFVRRPRADQKSDCALLASARNEAIRLTARVKPVRCESPTDDSGLLATGQEERNQTFFNSDKNLCGKQDRQQNTEIKRPRPSWSFEALLTVCKAGTCAQTSLTLTQDRCPAFRWSYDFLNGETDHDAQGNQSTVFS